MTGDNTGKSLFDRAVGGMVCCGTSPADWGNVQQVAEGQGVAAVIPAYGLHPWFLPSGAGADTAVLERLAALLESDPRAAVGEIGLDFAKRDGASRARQVALLFAQLELAQRLDRVAVIHCVRAWGVLAETLETVGPVPRGFVLHAYSGSAEMVPLLVRHGALFSFKASGGIPSPKVAERMRAVPSERLLLESDLNLGGDSTDAALQSQSLDHVAAQLAAATGMTQEQVASLTAGNTRRCFGV